MGEVEGVGEAVTGALLAGAVEPTTGERPADTEAGHCRNCGSALAGPYCSQCGQRARIHRSLRTYFADFAAGLFNFEGKFWRTLPMLAWRPGELTRRYVEGERAKFFSPVALYLFSVFLMFAILNITGSLGSPQNFREELRAELVADRAELRNLEAQRNAAAAAGRDTAEIERKIARRRTNIRENEQVLSGSVVTAGDSEDVPPLLRPLVERASQDPDLLMADIQEAASKFSWLLIPFSVPFLWLLFPLKRKHRLFDHAVFVTYSLSFMMLLVIAASLLSWANLPGVAGLLSLIPPLHMYRQLKGAYRLGTISALARTAALLVFAFIAVSIFAIAVIGLGLIS